MNKNVKYSFGLIVFIFTLGLNYLYAFKDYGIVENAPSTSLLSHASTNPDWPGDDSDYPITTMWSHKKTDEICYVFFTTTEVSSTGTILEETQVRVPGYIHKCVKGWDMKECKPRCFEFYVG